MKIRPTFLDGMAWTAAFLGVMSLLAVNGFHYPEYLTTPRLREVYSDNQLRTLLYTVMILTSILAPLALVFSNRKRQALLGLVCVMLAWLAGGADVSYGGQVRDSRFYISLDWVLLDLVIIATLFINIELFSRLKPDQGILRRGWQVDLSHYVVNHMFNGGLVYLLFLPAHFLQGMLSLQQLQGYFSSLAIPVQVFLIMLVTDIAQYWVHRAFHRVPFLWRFHRVHHSVEMMDWLAGSRLHLVDVVATRSLSLVPMVLLGFSVEAINIYLPILALQSVFIHCNVRWEMRWLDRFLTTPKYHHWHHTSDAGHLDRNFAISLPFLDHLFGTHYNPRGKWPAAYGLAGDTLEERYMEHLVAPFRRRQVKDQIVNGG